MDMKNVNPNLRDIVAYRIKYCEHPHAGDKWCIYPSYDYTHCLVDSLEDIDYSICTLEFETRRESYFWLLAELDMFRPHVWEFSRLNVTGSLLSKRKIIVLVNKGIVRGFDDPRLLTLAGMRRRGYTPKAINKFCDLVGVSRAANVINVKLLEHCLREELDATVQRRMGIINPVRLVIENWQGEKEFDVANHPSDASMGSRKIKFTHDLLVDASDYRLDGSDSNFYGLAPGRVVGLKYSGNVTVKSIDVDEKTGKATCIRCDIDFDRAVKPKTNISWLSAAHAQRCEVRLYTPLLTDDKAAIVPDFLQYVDANSESVVADAAVEKNLTELPVHASVQFERFGYFSVDPDTKDGKLVMNRVVSLREDKEKAAPAPKPAAKASNKQPKQAKEPKPAAAAATA
jgi:glutaminyl-tRNA synthetase